MSKEWAVIACVGSVFAIGCESKQASSWRESHITSHITGPVQIERVSKGAAHDKRMEWWREARFGMFVHWGVYAVAAGNWNGKPVPSAGEWIMYTAKIPVPEYEPLAKQFNPVNYNASEWVRIAKDAGCKYIVITSKHHDGFALFNSTTSDWDIADRTPFGRDPLDELAKACKEQGVRLCFYHSIMDWHHPKFTREGLPEYNQYMRGQLKELLTRYGDIGALWFDGEWPEIWTEEEGVALEAYCRSIKPDIIINNRVGKARAGMEGHSAYQGAGDYDTPEQEIPARGLPNDWETCMTMNDTWGFKTDDHNWKSDTKLIQMLVDIASKGGNFLLNVGPTALGEIPPASVERMAAMGRWMKVNHEAIYGTDASPIGRMTWGRCTAKGNRLYLHVFDWPKDGKLRIPGLLTPIRSASLLVDSKTKLGIETSPNWTTLLIPKDAPTPPSSVIIAEFDAPPRAASLGVAWGEDGVISLDAIDATLSGTDIHAEHGPNYNLGFWQGDSDTATWTLLSSAAGQFKIELEISAEPASAGQRASIDIGGQKIDFVVPATKGWGDYQRVYVGIASLQTDVPTAVSVSPAQPLAKPLMNLRRIKLSPLK